MNDIQTLLEERGRTHGLFSDHAGATQALKDVMAVQRNWSDLSPSHREALDMIVHKIGRVLAGDPNFRDHWDDIAGYATLAAEACRK